VLAAILLASTPIAADPTSLRETVVKIDDATVRDWANAKHGDEIVLPWFDGTDLVAKTDRVEMIGDFVNVFARLTDDVVTDDVIGNVATGNVVLTIGKDSLVGAVNITGDTYRLRDLDDETYSLTETDGRQFLQILSDDHDGSEETFRRPSPSRKGSRAPVAAANLPLTPLKKILTREAVRNPSLTRFVDDGSTIDILVAITQSVKNWAEASGVNLPAEIYNMISETNDSFAISGIQPRLRLVGPPDFAVFPYLVQDSALMVKDIEALRDGVGALAPLHVLRDQYNADLVSLLVQNGLGPCGKNAGTACGRATRLLRFPDPGELPGSATWNADFENKGFSVVHINAAIDFHTFKHEVGHNLGATHDVYTFATVLPLSDPSADTFARGWVILDYKLRTVMSYNGLCDVVLKDYCRNLGRFSNPTQFLYLPPIPNALPFAEWLGNPAPGAPVELFGPADNVRAMNNMAWTVSNFRNSFAP
jgi:hypothetical protein